MKKTFLVAILFYALGVLTIVGCATTFPWPYYATSMPPTCYDQGILFGKTGKGGWPDKLLTACKPDPDAPPGSTTKPVKLKCITLMSSDFYSLKADDEKCHNDLQSCQKGPQP